LAKYRDFTNYAVGVIDGASTKEAISNRDTDWVTIRCIAIIARIVCASWPAAVIAANRHSEVEQCSRLLCVEMGPVRAFSEVDAGNRALSGWEFAAMESPVIRKVREWLGHPHRLGHPAVREIA
jgi:hypothetical protein